jgi:hypothetical protein
MAAAFRAVDEHERADARHRKPWERDTQRPRLVIHRDHDWHRVEQAARRSSDTVGEREADFSGLPFEPQATAGVVVERR